MWINWNAEIFSNKVLSLRLQILEKVILALNEKHNFRANVFSKHTNYFLNT